MNIKFYIKQCYLILLSIIILVNIQYTNCSAATTTDKIDTKKIDSYVLSEMDSANIPGLTLGIVKDNETVYIKGYGKSDTNGHKVTGSTPFILGSVSKSFTALAIMQLKEQGKIDLDAPVQKYLPWFSVKNENETSKITVRNLLNQTSGFSTYSGLNQFAAVNKSSDELVREQSEILLTKPVGKTFQYSNSNFITLGKIIEAVSGLSYEEYIKKNIFSPLGMKNSYVSQTEARKNKMAQGFRLWLGFPFPSDIENSSGNVPAGYLISSAEDMTHYLKAQMNGGVYKNVNILSRKGMDEMHTVGINSGTYGMGWFIDHYKIYHDGLVPNFRTFIRFSPNNHIGLFISFNTTQTIIEHASFKDSAIYRIPTGIMNLLDNQPPPNPGKVSTITNNVNIILLLIIILTIISLLRLKGLKSRINNSLLNVPCFILLTLIINFIIPSLILILVPKFSDTPWKALVLYAQDLAYVLLAFSFANLGIGFIKMFMFINVCISNKVSKPSTL